jgi:hypothetical protein
MIRRIYGFYPVPAKIACGRGLFARPWRSTFAEGEGRGTGYDRRADPLMSQAREGGWRESER